VNLIEAIAWVRIFPQLTAVVKHYSSKQEITIPSGINAAQCFGCAHHLRDVLHQATTSSVMVAASGSGATENITEFVKKHLRDVA
jgi:hypothetical protein